MSNQEALNLNMRAYCTVKFEALHRFPDAKSFCHQGYLENLHRHIFHIKCEWNVTHTNREKEFIDLQHEVREFLQVHFPIDSTMGIPNMGPTSCEMLAVELLQQLGLERVEVSEDGENGAIVEKSGN